MHGSKALIKLLLNITWQAFTTCYVKMAKPIHFIEGKWRMKQLKAGKSRKTCLTNRTWPISHHITPLVINGLGGGHTDTCTHTYQHANQNNFKKPGARGRRARAPGLKIAARLVGWLLSAATLKMQTSRQNGDDDNPRNLPVALMSTLASSACTAHL